MSSNVHSDVPVASSHASLSIHAERCAHQQIARSNCQACIDVCPRNAWRHEDDGLSFDPDACDDCGRCVAVCPHEALSIPEPVAHVIGESLVLACERVAAGCAPNAVGVVACLHALSPDWIIRKTRQHHRGRLRMACNDCSACERAQYGQSLTQRWRPIAERLGTFAPRLEYITPTQWREITADAQAPDLARRRFFGRILAPRPAQVLPTEVAVSAKMTSHRVNTVAHLAGHVYASVKPTLWELEIDPMRCTACMVCVRLCPQRALTHCVDPQQSDEEQSIALWHARCTGCQLCAHVCEHAAITIHEPEATASVAERQQHIALQSLVCTQCKTPFHIPRDNLLANGNGHSGLCPICLAGRVHHTQRVVQAFDVTAGRAAHMTPPCQNDED